jgi:predicted  nucleic acid-binding Zn-ribbon protein
MRLVTFLVPGVVCSVALTLLGCTGQNERIRILEQENTRLSTELAAAREELSGASQRVAEAQSERQNLQDQLEQHVVQLTAAKLQEEITRKALDQARQDLQARADEQAKGLAHVQAAAATAQTAQQEAQKRVAELEKQVADLQNKLAEAEQALQEAKQTKEKGSETTR